MAVLQSAGLLLHRRGAAGVEVLLGHLGGPFWARRHEAAWTIPKGVVEPDEELADTARREFTEELGLPVPPGPWTDLGEVRQSRKTVRIWTIEADLDPLAVEPGEFEMVWPPGSGTVQRFPELDRVQWFTLDEAEPALVVGQRAFLARLSALAD
ncbi:hydrolase, NUDIX family [Aeromicrobium marinum DSM 15272]|uniref:Hydrolase, NUDIX family n=1 Tax=Aeromicrobium marinum DSM 15272 TaxID=585531 RepID=E2SG53_9ACTN|nr:NUDIX domain-containing protein [Aeromicrobium marinum]EFQ81810.1 hydrolase, NUDIX family [Aeromicrobium marinum DSM 15272]